MSKSHHTTWNDLKGKAKKEIEEVTKDPDSLLNEMAKKRIRKKAVKANMKTVKEQKKNEL